jgi:hypothetical protein
MKLNNNLIYNTKINKNTMTQNHIKQIATLLKGRLINQTKVKDIITYTFSNSKRDILLEWHQRNTEFDNYVICTYGDECWDAYRDIRQVKKHIMNFMK